MPPEGGPEGYGCQTVPAGRSFRKVATSQKSPPSSDRSIALTIARCLLRSFPTRSSNRSFPTFTSAPYRFCPLVLRKAVAVPSSAEQTRLGVPVSPDRHCGWHRRWRGTRSRRSKSTEKHCGNPTAIETSPAAPMPPTATKAHTMRAFSIRCPEYIGRPSQHLLHVANGRRVVTRSVMAEGHAASYAVLGTFGWIAWTSVSVETVVAAWRVAVINDAPSKIAFRLVSDHHEAAGDGYGRPGQWPRRPLASQALHSNLSISPRRERRSPNRVVDMTDLMGVLIVVDVRGFFGHILADSSCSSLLKRQIVALAGLDPLPKWDRGKPHKRKCYGKYYDGEDASKAFVLGKFVDKPGEQSCDQKGADGGHPKAIGIGATPSELWLNRPTGSRPRSVLRGGLRGTLSPRGFANPYSGIHFTWQPRGRARQVHPQAHPPLPAVDGQGWHLRGRRGGPNAKRGRELPECSDNNSAYGPFGFSPK